MSITQNHQENLEFIHFTPREQEILQLIANGLNNQEIAQYLLLSEQTVRNYVCKIYSKIGANNRVHAVLRALDLGVISIPNGREK